MTGPDHTDGRNRLAGHALPDEGRLSSGTLAERNGPGPARCSCGAESPELPNPSQRRKWHRDHKAEVRYDLALIPRQPEETR